MTFIRNPKDFWAGILYIAFGVAAIAIALKYPIGSAGRMGPGYFPRALGILLIAIGLILSIRSFRLQGTPMTFGSFKPLLVVIGSVVVFGIAAAPLGLVVATVLLVIVSSAASDEFRWKEAVISSLLLAVFTVFAFSYGLKLQLPVWPCVPRLGDRHGAPHNLSIGFEVAVSLPEPAVRVLRRAPRHADRRAARHRSGADDRDAAAHHVRAAAGLRAHHARRHLLRRAVRRIDDRHSGQPAGRVVVGGHMHRRLPDGATGHRRARRSRWPRSARSSRARSRRC